MEELRKQEPLMPVIFQAGHDMIGGTLADEIVDISISSKNLALIVEVADSKEAPDA